MFILKYETLSNIFYFVGYVLFFLMLFLATKNQQLKMALLSVVTIGIICRLYVLKGIMRIDRDILIFYIGIIFIGVLGQFVGWYNNSPGYSKTLNVYVLYPILYVFIIEAIQDKKRLIALFKVMVLTGILISLYILSYVLVKIGLLPDFIFISLGLDERVNFSGKYVELNVSSIVSIIYLFPFLCSIILSKNFSPIFSKKWINICMYSFSLMLIISIISGRRSLWVIMVFGVIVHFVLIKISKGTRFAFSFRSIISLLLISSIIVAVLNYFDISLIAIFLNILDGFNPQEDHGAGVRSEQFQSLLRGFFERPLIGFGNGSSPDAMMQRLEPWAFELSYAALIYHNGILGLAIYGTFVIWLYYKGIKIIKSESPYGSFMLPILVATSCFLTANSVNPYLQKFDFIWTILFFPALIINLDFIYHKNKVQRKETHNEVL